MRPVRCKETLTNVLFTLFTTAARSWRALRLAAVVTLFSTGAGDAAGAGPAGQMWDPICGFDYSPELHAERLRQLELLKAAILLRCLELIEWPEGNPPAGEITVGLVGKSPFAEAAKSLGGRTVGGRTLRIRELPDIKETANCQVVFISSSEKRRVEELLESLGSRPVLTVGETPKFAQRGGMINLVINGRKVEVELNPSSADSARFQMPPRLIKLAKVVAKD